MKSELWIQIKFKVSSMIYIALSTDYKLCDIFLLLSVYESFKLHIKILYVLTKVQVIILNAEL